MMFGHSRSEQPIRGRWAGLDAIIEYHSDRIVVHAVADTLDRTVLGNILTQKFFRQGVEYSFETIDFNAVPSPHFSQEDAETELLITYFRSA